MSMWRRLQDDTGQSALIFFFVMSGLFALMALLINVGALLQSGHQLQGAADSASLAGAQAEVSTSSFTRRDFFAGFDGAQAVRQDNVASSSFSGTGSCPGGYCADYRDGTASTAPGKPAIEVNLSKNFSFYLAGVFNLIGLGPLADVTLHAGSVASTEAPVQLDQIAPLALECDLTCQNKSTAGSGVRPWPLAPDPGSTVTFHYPLSGPATKPRLALIKPAPQDRIRPNSLARR